MKGRASIWMGNFDNEESLKEYTEIKYTEDGDSIQSLFEKDFDLGYYDRDLVEKKFLKSETSVLNILLQDFSYSESFDLETIKIDKKYNSVILIYDYEDLITVSTEFLNDKMDYLGQISYEKVVDCRW